MRSGITGLAHANGRNDRAWDERLELDVRFVEHMSFCLDLSIIAMTLRQVIMRDGMQVTTEDEGRLSDLRTIAVKVSPSCPVFTKG